MQEKIKMEAKREQARRNNEDFSKDFFRLDRNSLMNQNFSIHSIFKKFSSIINEEHDNIYKEIY